MTDYEGCFARCKVAIWGFAETCSEGEFEEQCDLDTTRSHRSTAEAIR